MIYRWHLDSNLTFLSSNYVAIDVGTLLYLFKSKHAFLRMCTVVWWPMHATLNCLYPTFL